MDWQPIETAPQDGTVIDLWVQHHASAERCANCFWHPGWEPDNKGSWRQQYAEASGSDFDVSGVPTHWMPLPEPPKP